MASIICRALALGEVKTRSTAYKPGHQQNYQQPTSASDSTRSNPSRYTLQWAIIMTLFSVCLLVRLHIPHTVFQPCIWIVRHISTIFAWTLLNCHAFVAGCWQKWNAWKTLRFGLLACVVSHVLNWTWILLLFGFGRTALMCKISHLICVANLVTNVFACFWWNWCIKTDTIFLETTRLIRQDLADSYDLATYTVGLSSSVGAGCTNERRQRTCLLIW